MNVSQGTWIGFCACLLGLQEQNHHHRDHHFVPLQKQKGTYISSHILWSSWTVCKKRNISRTSFLSLVKHRNRSRTNLGTIKVLTSKPYTSGAWTKTCKYTLNRQLNIGWPPSTAPLEEIYTSHKECASAYHFWVSWTSLWKRFFRVSSPIRNSFNQPIQLAFNFR